jgi:hypothetical protein
MATPKAGYRTRDGEKVPSVTTILSRFKESGGLIHWSWNIAHEPLMKARALLDGVVRGEFAGRAHEIEGFLALPVEDFHYRTKRDKAADAGTCAHDMVECFIRGQEFDAEKYPHAILEMARPAFDAFLEWADQTQLRVVETEVSLVSERYRFGGTRDAMLVRGKRALGDWKTSNRIYPEYLFQLAAYGLLDEEQGNAIDGGFHLLRFSKQERPDDPVNFVHHYWSQLDVARDAFLAMRELYDVMKRLEKLAA